MSRAPTDTLGLSYKEHYSGLYTTANRAYQRRLQLFFSESRPEGALAAFLAQRDGLDTILEFPMLAALGFGLPREPWLRSLSVLCSMPPGRRSNISTKYGNGVGGSTALVRLARQHRPPQTQLDDLSREVLGFTSAGAVTGWRQHGSRSITSLAPSGSL